MTQKYNTLQDVWLSTNRIPTQRGTSSTTYGAAAATLADKIYVIGGGSAAPTKRQNEVYSTLTDTWATKASVPSAGYSGPFIGAWGGTTLIVGGGGPTSNYVHKYTPATDGWITGAHPSLATGAELGRGVLGRWVCSQRRPELDVAAVVRLVQGERALRSRRLGAA